MRSHYKIDDISTGNRLLDKSSILGLYVHTKNGTRMMIVLYLSSRYQIISIEDVLEKGLYLENLAKKVEVIKMAKATISMPEYFLLKVSQLEKQTDEILPRMLDVAGEIVLAQTKANLSSVISAGTKLPSRSTGELESVLGLSKALQDRNGNWNVKVGFSEPRRDGVSNAKLATIIDYGKHGQPAKTFMKATRTKSRKAAIEAMKAKLESEMNG